MPRSRTIKETPTVKPFLKWAGGKRWFVYQHADLLIKPAKRYIEPFLGSGAVFFHINPKRALLGDTNPDLINCFESIRDNHSLVYRYLRDHHRQHSKKYYYKIRDSSPTSPASRAAKFIYLNRTCWNGLYRVNKTGQFNVPIGTKDTVIFSDDDFASVASRLRNAILKCSDFEYLIDRAREGDLVFVDPPYTVRHNHNAFIKYNEKLFSWWDQERLFHAVRRAQTRGARIVGTNAFHDCIRELYGEDFDLIETSRNSPISSKISTRNHFEELIILSREV